MKQKVSESFKFNVLLRIHTMGKSEMFAVFQWLTRLKSVHRISNKVIGDAIGYSGVGAAKAIKNQTLSLDQVREIAEKTGHGEEFSKLFETQSNEKTPPEEARIEDVIANKVYQRMDARLKNLEEQNKDIKDQNRNLTELVLGMIPVSEKILNSLSKIENKGEV